MASLLCVGCHKEENPLDGTPYNTIITVKGDNAKTTLNPQTGDVDWSEGDQISVFRGNVAANGAFVLHDVTNGVATFLGNMPESADEGVYYAVYPYDEEMTIYDGQVSGFSPIPTTQYFSHGSFGIGANTSVGYSDATTMKFSNVGALAKIYIRGTMPIKSIKLIDDDNNKISGPGRVDIPTNTISFEGRAHNFIIAKASDGTYFSASPSGQFYYFVVPPCTLQNYTIEVVDAAGVTHTKSFTHAGLRFDRSSMATIGALEVNIPSDATVFTYTTTTGKKLSAFEVGSRICGTTVVAHTFNDGQGVVTLNDPITTWDECVHGNDTLKSINLPDCITTIGEHAFLYCSGLTAVELPSRLTTLGRWAFSNTNLYSVELPNTLQNIGEYALSYCENLHSVILPSSMTSIPDRMFYASGLLSYTIPDGVTSIGKEAFHNAPLTNIVMPQSMESIGQKAFSYCYYLATITCYAANPPAVGSEAFIYLLRLEHIYVPAASVAAYKAADGWSDFSDKIVGF